MRGRVLPSKLASAAGLASGAQRATSRPHCLRVHSIRFHSVRVHSIAAKGRGGGSFRASFMSQA